MSISLSFTVPASGLIEPLIILNRVVLPAPLGPIRAVIEVYSISRDTLFMALKPPKLL